MAFVNLEKQYPDTKRGNRVRLRPLLEIFAGPRLRFLPTRLLLVVRLQLRSATRSLPVLTRMYTRSAKPENPA